MICKNCGNTFEGNYCNHCGQKATTERITFVHFMQDLTESVFQVHKGILYTAKELTIRPGTSLRNYLKGQRKNHIKPVAYVLSLSTIYFILTQLTDQNTWADDLITGWMTGATGQNPDEEIPRVVRWIAKNYAYATLLLLPIFSFASYISFLKYKKNYLEHIVINAYITGHQAIIYVLFALANAFILNELLESLPIVCAVCYTFWVFHKLFHTGSLLPNMLRSVLTYLIYLVVAVIVLGTIAGLQEL